MRTTGELVVLAWYCTEGYRTVSEKIDVLASKLPEDAALALSLAAEDYLAIIGPDAVGIVPYSKIRDPDDVGSISCEFISSLAKMR